MVGMDRRAPHSRPLGPGRARGPVAAGLLVGFLGIFGGASPSQAAGHTVQAMNYRFVASDGGSTLKVAVGDQVTWIASSSTGEPHTVTSGAPLAIDDRFADHPAPGLLLPGDTFTTTFPTPGTYPYFCEIHPDEMRGTVIVVAAAIPTPTAHATVRPRPTSPPPAPTPSLIAPTTSPSQNPAGSEPPVPTPSASVSSPAPSPPSAGATTSPETPGAGGGAAGGTTAALAALATAAVLGGILVALRRGRGWLRGRGA